MAKRAPIDEQPYRPLLDPSVISAALEKASTADPVADYQDTTQPAARPAKVVEMRRPEAAVRRSERPEQYSVPAERFVQGEERGGAIGTHEFVEKFDQERRMLLTRGESMALDRLVSSLAVRFNTQVKLSHVLRALVALLLHSENELDQRAGEAIGLTRPPNGDARALQRFEKEIARVLAAAIRDAGPVR